MKFGSPLWDMASPLLDGAYFRDGMADRFLSVISPRLHTLGVPTYLRDEDAIALARRRGWRVAGIWKPKAPISKVEAD